MSRPTKRPNPEWFKEFFVLDLFSKDISAIRKKLKHKAPLRWRRDEFEFLFDVAFIPSMLNAQEFASGDVAQAMAETSRKELELFGRLYAEAPDVLLEVLTAFRAVIEKRSASPEFAVKLALGQFVDNEGIWTTRAEDIAAVLTKRLKRPVTAKVIEHARSEMRRYRRFVYD